MNDKTKQIVDTAFGNIAKYEVKVGVNCMGYNMQLDYLKSNITNEVELQVGKELLVEKLIANKLWKISRISFEGKELYKARLLKFNEGLVKEGIMVKDKTATNRFLLVNDNTKEFYVVTPNISKCAMPKEITRHEMIKNRKVSKKEVIQETTK